MKNRKQTKGGFRYPAGTLGSLKGDPEACWKWWRKKWTATRRARREAGDPGLAAVMTTKIASEYLGVSVSKFASLCREYPNMLRSMNLNTGGDTCFSRETLDKFIRWRESVGFEKRAG